ncbi:T6SS phospholipase effector Tle1-like catalytic domain-containing protein [Glaciimonas soli]|uniref:DUF2235 domain-containing protein n=1 Tax=Glaciimonas soli TaxID=2590999 RepID=A0A843YR87_9BURK|nr:DUF2235 domain-containing protein [Glaciimonas soli]MQR00244.1 DUF2235 domain-containing protein [Glaciimonas soli]
MTAKIRSAPLSIFDRAEACMMPDTTDVACRILKEGKPTTDIPPCQKNVNIGVFFDGTNNNMIRDEPIGSHTNVVKLYKAHKSFDGDGNLKVVGHYKIYAPGVGTRFPENNELREDSDGKAFGWGGQARIIFGLLQVYNAVHQAFNDDIQMFNDQAISAKLKQYTKDVEGNDSLRDPHETRDTRRTWFKKITDELIKKRKEKDQPYIPKITLNVFGFSRGAVQARAFCYWFNDVLVDGMFAGIPAEINFLGIFDSVSSVGTNSSMKLTLPVPFTGHAGWSGEILKPLPGCVKQTVHYIAAHEQRMNFPVTRVTGQNVTEVMYPGVHCDVGGGYGPKEQGKAKSMGQLISQIPLLHMHKAAVTAGVPLLPYCVMDDRLKKDYDIDSDLGTSWSAYMAAFKEAYKGDEKVDPKDPNVLTDDFHKMTQKHMGLFYAYREQYLNDFKAVPCYRPSTPQEQEDAYSYNDYLKIDLAALRLRIFEQGKMMTPYDASAQQRDYALVDPSYPRHNSWLYYRYKNKTPVSNDELWALKEFENPMVGYGAPFLSLLTHQVHDSLAGFYLSGYITNEEKTEQVLKFAKGKAPTTPYNSQVWSNFQALPDDTKNIIYSRVKTLQAADDAPGYRLDVETAKEKASEQTVFSPDEQAALLKDKDGNELFPIQKDSDNLELRPSATLATQTSTRREGGGYLLLRMVY